MVTDLLAFVASGGGGLPLIGGGVIGFGTGYILKKIAKILIIAIGGIATNELRGRNITVNAILQ